MGQLLTKSPSTGNIFNLMSLISMGDMTFKDAVQFYDLTFKLYKTSYSINEADYSQENLEELSNILSTLAFGGKK